MPSRGQVQARNSIAAETDSRDAASARRVANFVAVLAEAFAAWNLIACYLARLTSNFDRPDLVNLAATARRREALAAVLVVVFFAFATYSLSRSPRRAHLPARRRYLKSALLALAGVILILGIEVLALGLIFRGVHLN